jgi:hypothetical protein
MAEWKKIIVSGSDISQLNNDSGYLIQTDTIDSASVAAIATTLSPDATASFADRATSASIADELSQLATASFAITASHALNVPNTASFALSADSASVADRATTLSPDATASYADLASVASSSLSASVAARATELSADATASFADRATTASFADLAGNSRTADSASVAARATTLSADATASYADLASVASSSLSASVAAIATELSPDATASYADNATTASHAVSAATASHALDIKDQTVTTAKIVDGNVTNVKLANDSVMVGSTNIELGATASSLTGLTSISATTGSFVLQIFESSSVIITSGSNIFGDQESDTQQFTGSILTTGSIKVTGSIYSSGEIVSDKFSGSFSGSFQGDGSGLTGLATDLGISGSTGGGTVDLQNQILTIQGTADEIETVASGQTVTIGLPDSIIVTASLATNAESASVAARATTLSAEATASFALSADSASVAAIATELSPDATASFADSATSASQAESATSASATVGGVLFPTTDGLINQALVTDGAGQLDWGDIFGTGSTKKLNQSVAAATWSFNHNLNELYPIVQVYDSTGDQLLPDRIESVDVNNVRIYFAGDTAGVAAAMVGGMGISASNATAADSASVAARATTLSPDATASFADRATSASIADELSQLATASIANTATTASHALSGAGLFSGSFIGDGSGLTGVAGDFNFEGDTGATTINLLTETASFVGVANQITTSVTADNTLTIGLPDNVTITNNLTVTNDAVIAGNLTVGGAIVSASSLEVADQFIILASGSNGAIDGGIIVNQIDNDPDGKGVAFAYDSSANRWALETGLSDTASVITPDAYMGVIQESAGAPSTDPIYGGTAGKGTIFVDTSNNEAYIYI